MLDRRNFLQAAGASILVACGAARARAAAIEISRTGLIFLTIEVNGRAAKALVDTGSVRGLQLSSALAGALGLAAVPTGRTTERYDGAHALLGTRVSILALAGLELADVEASVSPGDIETISRQIGEAFDAILGWPLLGARPFVIDYAGRTLELRDERGAAGIVLPLEVGRALPVTAGSLAGEGLTFLVDTGAPHCNVDVSLAGGAEPGSRIELPFEVGGRAFTTSFRVRDLAPMTRGVGARAVIGHRFLAAYRFVWQPEAGAIRLV
jgi:hypothetical protein